MAAYRFGGPLGPVSWYRFYTRFSNENTGMK